MTVKPTRQRITLNAVNTNLVRAYNPDALFVHVFCDSSKGGFTVELPEQGVHEKTAFVFSNVTSDGSAGAAVTLKARSINFVDTEYTLGPQKSTVFIDAVSNRTYITTEWDTVNCISFDLNYPCTPSEGVLHWEPDDGVLEYGLPGGNVRLQIGMEQLLPRRVRNTSGVDILNGDLVYSTSGGVALAKADNFLTSRVSGMATEDIPAGQFGWVTTFGIVRGDTDQPINVGAYAVSTSLFLSATTAGKFTNAVPSAPNNKVFIGRVWRQHAVEGEIYVRTISTPNLSDLSDVNETAPEDGAVIKWNAAAGYWEYTSTAPVWEDMQVSISNIFVPLANAPTDRLYAFGISGGVTFPVKGFAVGDYVYFDIQTSHSMKLSSVLENHFHYCLPNTTNIGDRFKFQLDVVAAPKNAAYAVPTGSPFSAEFQVAANDDTYSRIGNLAEIPAVNTTVSTVYHCKFTRVAASANEYGSEVYLTFNDSHYMKDTVGSKTETSK